MISVTTLVRDTIHIDKLFDMLKRKMPCEYEICIGDNSTDPAYSEMLKEIADEYVYISDKQLFRMGVPWAHNLVNSLANTYKIFYLDGDEYPVWIHPQIEDAFDYIYILPVLRYDFPTFEEINYIDENFKTPQEIIDYCKDKVESKEWEGSSLQDRVYNSRYVKFEGVCHSVFHAPPHFRANTIFSIYLHNKDVRQAKDKERMDRLVDEQFARQNVNPYLASSNVVLGWGKNKKHLYKDWKEFVEDFK